MTGRLGGATPTLPALQGALEYAPRAANESARTTNVVLVTGGLPTQCQSSASLEAVAAEAARSVEEERVLTHVIGVGTGLRDLHQVAQAGGTCEAYLVEEGDAAAQVTEAIENIWLPLITQMPCEFDIPTPLDPTRELDLDNVQVRVQSATGSPERIPQVVSEEHCELSLNGGWYYDNNESPEGVLLCPCLCNRIDSRLAEVRYSCVPRGGIE